MVASTHWLASQSGMAVLERGGNAFDAAVAAGLVLHVVEPHLNGFAGDLPVVAAAAGSEPFVLCGQGTAPGAATPEVFADLGLDHVPGTGLLAAVVPGAFGTWMDMLARYGTWRVADVLAFAIGYARDGFPLLAQASATIARVADHFREHWPSSAATYLPGDEVPAPSSRLRLPGLAATLERIVEESRAAGPDRLAEIEGARRAFYEGFVAEEIGRFAATEELMDSSGRRHRGLLTADDLAGWRVREERPTTVEFAGRTIAKTGPWGQGPVLLQQLRMLEGMDLEDTRPGSAELVHAVVETAKLAYADRDHWYADPDHADVPLTELLSTEYAAQRRALVGATASDEHLPGAPGGRAPRGLPDAVVARVDRALAGAADDGAAATPGASPAGVGEPTFGTEPAVRTDGSARGDTCHLDVVDRWGNIVSATPSGAWLQSSPVVTALGFPLPTRAQMFWVEPGLPGSVAPHKRPRTTLSPTLVLRDGRPEIACGTPGGDQQDQWQVPLLLNHLVYGMGLQEAIDAPTWHTTHLVSSFDPRDLDPLGVTAEDRLGPEVLAELRRRGHRVTASGPWSLGRLSAVAIGRDGMLRAAATPRGMQGYAVGR
nr:gamma-glutamyltransferase family protein [Actinotalea sp. Marseille-Q4924]